MVTRNAITEIPHGRSAPGSQVAGGGDYMTTDRRRPNTPRAADFIVEHLASTGVQHIFGVDGAIIEDLYDAAHFTPAVTAILAKHEFSAATVDGGYSRSGAGLGIDGPSVISVECSADEIPPSCRFWARGAERGQSLYSSDREGEHGIG